MVAGSHPLLLSEQSVHMPSLQNIVFLIDVDDTLFDNDRFEAELSGFLEEKFGPEERDLYRTFFEECRKEEGFADFLGAFQKFRIAVQENPATMELAYFFRDYPFSRHLYPKALDVLSTLSTRGTTVILSDGDAFFQPHKIDRAGIRKAANGKVRIYVHKETRLDRLEKEFPARHYVLVDDKRRILSSVKKQWENRVTTVWVRQGHYAREAPDPALLPPDRTIAKIEDLLEVSFSEVSR
jgi:FMN phosphatase YigB (HAD superfamily)